MNIEKINFIEIEPCTTIDQAYENLQKYAPACTEFNGAMLLSTDTLSECYDKVFRRETGHSINWEERTWQAALAFYKNGHCTERGALIFARNFVDEYRKCYCETIKQTDHETDN